ncbi:hypothetical protein CAL26_05090 [Bordetella genomosp. 9]|uniref:SF4 helicase domain-containing protein n=1 Tax=Bordetella genomosp. 9 TaxID=1416803 RepID=A0A261RNT9_9BORD|nr:DnaB-like helicase C-terminal domain-containing protein [Bordetella genomosp. 9]OZI26699.1 hypothetical protein CAL26_05090 [Bordetella genomosp. 9]
MSNVQKLIIPSSMNFQEYMVDAEPKAKVLSPEAWRDELIASTQGGHSLSGAKLPWGKTHEHIRFRGGEVTLWQGINGHGKSQLLGQSTMSFAAQGEKVCVASFEMKPLSTLKRMLRQASRNGNPGEVMANRLIDWLEGKYWFYDQQGQVKPEMMYAVIRYCADKLKIKHIVIDSLMKCVRGEDDYNGQKDFVDMLTALARDHNVHIHLVHHVRKAENEDKVPGKFDAKGSGAISDQVDQVLTVWRNKAKERAVEQAQRSGAQLDEKNASAPDALLICDKNRHGEWEGKINLWYDPQSLQYTSDKRCIPLDLLGEDR